MEKPEPQRSPVPGQLPSMRTRGILRLLTVLLAAALCAGCWDYKEIDDQVIIAGTAIDYDPGSRGILLTTEIALPTSSEKESSFESKIYQGRGQNILDAAVDLRAKAGRRLLWSHSKVLILSRELMAERDLFIGILDWVKRNHQMRDTSWLLLSKERSAAAILQQAAPQTEKITSYYLDHFFAMPQSEIFLSMTYSKFIANLQSEGGCTALPTARLANFSNGVLPFVDGTALFLKTRPVGWLDGRQTRTLSLLLNKLGQAVLAPEPSEKQKLQTVSLKVSHCQTAIEPAFRRKKLIMTIRVKMTAAIGEIDGAKDVFQPEKIKKVAAGAESVITARIHKLLELLQGNYRCDILGFGNQVAVKYPRLWLRLKRDWPNEFAKLPAVIRVKVDIDGSEQSMKETQEGQ